MKRRLISLAVVLTGIAAPVAVSLGASAATSTSAICQVGVKFGTTPGAKVDPQDPFGSGVTVETGDPYIVNTCKS